MAARKENRFLNRRSSPHDGRFPGLLRQGSPSFPGSVLTSDVSEDVSKSPCHPFSCPGSPEKVTPNRITTGRKWTNTPIWETIVSASPEATHKIGGLHFLDRLVQKQSSPVGQPAAPGSGRTGSALAGVHRRTLPGSIPGRRPPLVEGTKSQMSRSLPFPSGGASALSPGRPGHPPPGSRNTPENRQDPRHGSDRP